LEEEGDRDSKQQVGVGIRVEREAEPDVDADNQADGGISAAGRESPGPAVCSAGSDETFGAGETLQQN
jgi:hypothetical protein